MSANRHRRHRSRGSGTGKRVRPSIVGRLEPCEREPTIATPGKLARTPSLRFSLGIQPDDREREPGQLIIIERVGDGVEPVVSG